MKSGIYFKDGDDYRLFICSNSLTSVTFLHTKYNLKGDS